MLHPRGIAFKFSALCIGLVIITSLVLVTKISRDSNQSLIERELQRLQSQLEFREVNLLSKVELLKSNVQSLTRAPTLIALAGDSGQLDQIFRDTHSRNHLKRAVEQLFLWHLRDNPAFYQIRYLDETGKEIVRAETKTNGDIVLVEEADLQNKGKTDYFNKTIHLPADKIYLSEINLNREHGKVLIPYIRTLRASAPLYSENGEAEGIIVINLDIGPVLDRLSKSILPNDTILIVKNDGDFLVHPNPEFTFGTDLGKDKTLTQLYSELSKSFFGAGKSGFIENLPLDGKFYSVVHRKVYFDKSDTSRYLGLIEIAPHESLAAQIFNVFQKSTPTLIVLVLAMVAFVVYVARLFTSRLAQLTNAANLISSGAKHVRLPTNEKDELGLFARTFALMLRQITAREREAQDRQTRLQGILDTVLEGVITTDEFGAIDSINASAAKMFGYEADELIGTNARRLIRSDDEQRNTQEVRSSRNKHETRNIHLYQEGTALRKDGTTFPTYYALSETYLGGKSLFVCTIQDVTHLQKVESDIRDYAARLHTILDTVVNGVITINDRSVIESVNPAALQIFGYNENEVLEQDVKMLLPPEEEKNQEIFKQDYLDSNYKNNLGKDRERTGRRKDGSLFPINLAINEARIGQQRLFVGVVTDISERVENEQRIVDYARRLRASNKELQDFAYIASHDMQEPLRKIQAFSDRLAEQEKTNLSERGQDYLQRVTNAASRMQDLINSLLTLSRVGTRGGEFVDVDLDKILGEVLSDLEARIADKKARIEIQSVGHVHGDPVQLRQLLQNLLSNALKFTDAERIPFIKVYSFEQQSAGVSNNTLNLVIQDNGIGFDAKYKDRIFSPFERLHSRETYEGTGIGLAICKKIVERHEGTITVDSAKGEGTTFVITLPRSGNGNSSPGHVKNS